jgi:7-carboxy-7-deazaguanine synthase
MRVTEIFFSIQGESSHAGKPCAFVRLTGCSLRCVWCDTKYSYSGGREMKLDDVLAEVGKYPTQLVEITGGEPLEQEEAYPLMDAFLGQGYTVMLETGGHVSVARVPAAVIKIIDVKCPDSGEVEKNFWGNFELSQPHDEFKFVIASRKDYDWALDVHRKYLKNKENVALFSPAQDLLPAVELARWILEGGVAVRMQLQLHKFIWSPQARGV